MSVVSLQTGRTYVPQSPAARPGSGPPISDLAKLLSPQRAVAFAAVEQRLAAALTVLQRAPFNTSAYSEAQTAFDAVMTDRRSFESELAAAAQGDPNAEELLRQDRSKLVFMQRAGLPSAADLGNCW